MATLTIVAVALIYQKLKPTPPAPQQALKRLTFDAGLQFGATWSPDGRFIAYCSDRGGKFDIWVQPVSGGDEVQVTKGPATIGSRTGLPMGSRSHFDRNVVVAASMWFQRLEVMSGSLLLLAISLAGH